MKGVRAINSRGFSIVELLVVIALMAAIVLVGLPAIVSQVQHMRLTRSVRNVTTELNAARLKAIARNTKYRVDFTQNAAPAIDTYRLALWNTSTAAWENDATHAPREIEGGVNFASPTTNFSVYFYPTGLSSSADNATATTSTICIENTSSTIDRMEITVQGTTGMISVTTGC